MICSRSLNGLVSAIAWRSFSSCAERALATPTIGCEERVIDATPNGSFQHKTGTRRPERKAAALTHRGLEPKADEEDERSGERTERIGLVLG